MRWVKGQSGNPKGRPTTTAVAEFREILKKKKVNLLEEALSCLDRIEEPNTKLNQIIKLLEFLYSKPKEIEVDLEHAIEIVRQALEERRNSGLDKGTRIDSIPTIQSP